MKWLVGVVFLLACALFWIAHQSGKGAAESLQIASIALMAGVAALALDIGLVLAWMIINAFT